MRKYCTDVKDGLVEAAEAMEEIHGSKGATPRVLDAEQPHAMSCVVFLEETCAKIRARKNAQEGDADLFSGLEQARRVLGCL